MIKKCAFNVFGNAKMISLLTGKMKIGIFHEKDG